MKKKRLVPVKEAADYLGVGSTQIFNLIAQGKLTKYIKPHRRRIYVDMDEVEAYDIIKKEIEYEN